MATHHLALCFGFLFYPSQYTVSSAQSENHIIHMDLSAMHKAFVDHHSWYWPLYLLYWFFDNIENHMEKFIIQVDKQPGSDRTALSGCFRNEMQTIESCLAETFHRMSQPSNDLQNCLMYCCIFPENFWIPKGKLIRLLVAEALIKEKAERVTEDIAEENIYEPVSQEMLLINEQPDQGTTLQVPSPHREFFLRKMKGRKLQNFIIQFRR
ncbi:hypothetical protein FNV43_RR20255 [Rhamnella rubrinervis]|uniref:Disease resistance protein winged helix domain-containing protein n=1 Tax=Rhamnella rubrinervis TaxID=2594499 RepID=A0A8K0GU09_9ROSA|nr:hypothetical protein FNV43_RR20255 [Rhamnella rubrinervis]